MKRTAIAFLICSILIQPVAAQQATKFKGFFVGMNKSDVIALKPAGYDAKEFQSPARIVFRGVEHGDQFYPNAVFLIDDQGVVTEMSLHKRFFGAEEMPQDQFAQAIADNYRIGRLSCEAGSRPSGTTINRVPQYEKFSECKGLSGNGEAISITEFWLNVHQTKAKPSFN